VLEPEKAETLKSDSWPFAIRSFASWLLTPSILTPFQSPILNPFSPRNTRNTRKENQYTNRRGISRLPPLHAAPPFEF
jgi:hypothetical protein